MNSLEIGLLIACLLLVGMLSGALWDIRRLHKKCMDAWAARVSAEAAEAAAREALAQAERRIGVMMSTRGDVLEAAIGAVKLAQLDALYAPAPHSLSEKKENGPEAV